MRRIGTPAYITSLLAIFAMLLVACGGGGSSSTSGGGNTPAAAKAKVALVTDIGGLNDNGFNHMAYTGYKKAETQYGFPEKIIQTQSQNDYVKNLTSAAQSADLVIAVGFLMETPLDQVAKQYPNKKFAIVDGCAVPDPKTGACETLPNVAPLFFKEQEAGCLVGGIAGQMEKDGMVSSSWDTSESGPARRVYSITHAGEAYLKYWAASLNQYQKMMDTFFQLYTGTGRSGEQSNKEQNDDQS